MQQRILGLSRACRTPLIEQFRASMHNHLTLVRDLPSPSPNGPFRGHHRTTPNAGREVPRGHILGGMASGTSCKFQTFVRATNVTGQRRGQRVTPLRTLPQQAGRPTVQGATPGPDRHLIRLTRPDRSPWHALTPVIRFCYGHLVLVCAVPGCRGPWLRPCDIPLAQADGMIDGFTTLKNAPITPFCLTSSRS